MSVANKRREVLKRLIEERFDGRLVDFARAIDRSPAHVWIALNRQGRIGERLARHIEAKLRLQSGELDREGSPVVGLTTEEVDLLQRFRRLAPDWKLLVRRILSGEKRQQDEALEAMFVPRFLPKGADGRPPELRVKVSSGRTSRSRKRRTSRKG